MLIYHERGCHGAVIQRGWLSISPVTISERSFIYRISAFVLLSRPVIPTVVFAASRDSSFALRSSRILFAPFKCFSSISSLPRIIRLIARFGSYQNPNKDVNVRVIGPASLIREIKIIRAFITVFDPCESLEKCILSRIFTD